MTAMQETRAALASAQRAAQEADSSGDMDADATAAGGAPSGGGAAEGPPLGAAPPLAAPRPPGGKPGRPLLLPEEGDPKRARLAGDLYEQLAALDDGADDATYAKVVRGLMRRPAGRETPY